MKAILRTYTNPMQYTDEIVEVDDSHDFTNSFADTVPFAVGSNQFVKRLEETSQRDLIKAIQNS